MFVLDEFCETSGRGSPDCVSESSLDGVVIELSPETSHSSYQLSLDTVLSEPHPQQHKINVARKNKIIFFIFLPSTYNISFNTFASFSPAL